MKHIISGITPTGTPHIGNYFGMFRPMLEKQSQDSLIYFFVSDQHTFTSKRDPEVFRTNLQNTILDWLALGVDAEKHVLFRQSDVPAHTELTWYLSCLAPMGLLERAHAYKDKVAKWLEPNVGLFNYPILMAADILLYDIDEVPVGKDQKQHVEIARDLAGKFNHHYGEVFKLPEPIISEDVMTIPWLDGAKMSKSYGNTIEIFADEKTLKKKIMSIETDSKQLGEPLDPDTCQVMAFHKLFENPNLSSLEDRYRNGEIGYGHSKLELFDLVWEYFSDARKKRAIYEQDPWLVDDIMQRWADRANEQATKTLVQVRKKMGIDS